MADPGSRISNQIQVLSRLLGAYDHSVPFHHYFQLESARHKQWGSKDRRFYRHASYSWFRLGNACRNMPFEERLGVALFLNPPYTEGILAYFSDTFQGLAWMDKTGAIQTPAERLQYLQQKLPSFNPDDVFPAAEHLSDSIDKQEFISNLWNPRPLWLRVTEPYSAQVKAFFTSENIVFREYGAAIAVPNGTDTEHLLRKGMVQVMDLASQEAAETVGMANGMRIWDCCAGAGGKSLYIASKKYHLDLYASDLRNSALENLQKRFRAMKLTEPFTAVVNLKEPPAQITFSHPAISPQQISHGYFDTIILDAPCTGSGTWGRTPEYLPVFKEADITIAKQRQLRIAAQVIPFLKHGGMLHYMTCSAYKDENEDVVTALKNMFRVEVVSQQLIRHPDSDTLFTAALKIL